MSPKPGKLERFWQELKRRKVIRVISVYAAAAFVILELTDIIAPSLGLPDWTLNLIIILLCIGFIITVILSWIYDVTPEGVEKTKPVKEIQKEERTTVSKSWKIATYASVVVILGLIVLNIISHSNRSKEIRKLEKSIAVLPFHNDSPDEANQHFIDGTMEAILDNLCKLQDLKVIARTSAEQYRNVQKDVTDIAKELNVCYILEGSGQKYGEKIRFTVQLINGNDGSHIWSKSFDRDLKDILFIQSEIAKLVAREIEVSITPEERQRIEKIPTENIEAYNEYLLGRFFYYKHTEESFKEGIAHLKKAIQLDSTFSLPYVYLVFSYQFMVRYNWVSPDDYYQEAEEAINKAFELDHSLGEAYAAMALFKFVFNWDLYGPDKDFQKAIGLNPGSSEVYALYSQYLRWFGRYEEGIEISGKAIKLDPVNPYTNLWLEVHYFYSGQYEKAIIQLKKMLLLDSDYIWTNTHLAFNYTLTGDYSNALKYADKSMSIGNTRNNPLLASSLAWVYAKSGKSEKAREMLNNYKEIPENGFSIGFIYHGLGENEKAIDWLYRAYEARVRSILYLKAFSDSYFKDLNSNPRFVELLKIIGFETK